MREAVVLKSYQNGIVIRLNPDASFQDILEELAWKFGQSRPFFGNAQMAVSIEGRSVDREEEIRILDVIHDSSDVEVACLVGHDEETDRLFLKALRQVKRRLPGDEDGQFYRGSLTGRERLETESSLILLGDVGYGCSVISTKDIIILGGLYGKAYAGGNGQEGHYVVALEMEPESLTIGDFKYRQRGRPKKRATLSGICPEVAFVRNGRIQFESLTKEAPDRH